MARPLTVCCVKKERTLEFFYVNKGGPSGLSSICKECAKERSRKWHANNPERARAQAKKYQSNNPERIREKHREWLLKNTEHAKDYQRTRRVKLRDSINEYMRGWAKENRERIVVWSRAARAKRMSAKGSHTKEDIQTLFVAQNGRCAACDISLLKYHVDHVMPLILGGSNAVDNLQILCPTCNRSKGGMHPEQWNKGPRHHGR